MPPMTSEPMDVFYQAAGKVAAVIEFLRGFLLRINCMLNMQKQTKKKPPKHKMLSWNLAKYKIIIVFSSSENVGEALEKIWEFWQGLSGSGSGPNTSWSRLSS